MMSATPEVIAEVNYVISPMTTEDEIISESGPAKREQLMGRKWCRIIGLFTLVIGVVIVVAVVTSIKAKANQTSNNNQSNENAAQQAERAVIIREAVQKVTPTSAFLDPSSAQSQAINWMIYSDQTPLQPETILQRYALLVFYYSTSGQYWNDVELWTSLPNVSECLWSGVTCNSTHGNLVTSLVLNVADAAGTIPDEMIALSTLQWLDLSSNRLVGSIPDVLFDLTNLGTEASCEFLYRM
jgi:hypothetical protein